MGSLFAVPGRAAVDNASIEHQHVPSAKRQRLGDPIRLNVGGKKFETSRSTLRQCRYFSCLLGGEFGETVDEDGCVFVDRDGELFTHILAWLRSKQRPPRNIIAEQRQSLLTECEYFGLDGLIDEVEGRTSYSDMRRQDRDCQETNAECCQFFADCLSHVTERSSDIQAALRLWEKKMLIAVFENLQQFPRRAAVELGLPLLFSKQDESGTTQSALQTASQTEFEDKIDSLTNGFFRLLQSIPGVVFAGGAVLGALVDSPATDLDIFLLGGDDATVREKFLEVMRRVQARPDWEVQIVTRTDLAVTIYSKNHVSRSALPVQIILAAFRSPLEVIANFDIDCCCCAYDTTSNKVLCTPRARRAICYRANVVDTSLRTFAYESRLEKYAQRGFAIAVPGLKEQSLDLAMFSATYLYDECFDVLMRLDGQPARLQPPQKRGFNNLEPVHAWWLGFGGPRDDHVKDEFLENGYTYEVMIKSEQRATRIHGLERLLIMDEAQNQNRGGVVMNKGFGAFTRRNKEDLRNEFMFATGSSQTDGEYIVLCMDCERNDSGGFTHIQNQLIKRWMQRMRGDASFDPSEPSEDGPGPRFLHRRGYGHLFESPSNAAAHCLSDSKPLGFLYWRGSVPCNDMTHTFFRPHIHWRYDEAAFKRFFGVHPTVSFSTGSPNYVLTRQLQAAPSFRNRDFFAGVYI